MEGEKRAGGKIETCSDTVAFTGQTFKGMDIHPRQLIQKRREMTITMISRNLWFNSVILAFVMSPGNITGYFAKADPFSTNPAKE